MAVLKVLVRERSLAQRARQNTGFLNTSIEIQIDIRRTILDFIQCEDNLRMKSRNWNSGTLCCKPSE